MNDTTPPTPDDETASPPPSTATPHAPAPAAPAAANAPVAGADWGGRWVRRVPVRIGLVACSGVMVAAAFDPMRWWAVAWVALVPWLVALAVSGRWFALISGLIVGAIWFPITLGWIEALSPEMGLIAFGATALALSLHLAIFALMARAGLKTGKWWGLAVAGAAWPAVEYIRLAVDLPLPFPWLFLGTTQVYWLEMAQMADLVGTLGLSGFIAGVNVALAYPLIRHLRPPTPTPTPVAGNAAEAPVPVPVPMAVPRRIWRSKGGMVVGAVVVAMAGAWGYGVVRIAQIEASILPGPKISLVQPNFLFDGSRRSTAVLAELTVQAYREDKPDLIAWPEATFFGVAQRAMVNAPHPADDAATHLRELQHLLAWRAVPAQEFDGERLVPADWPYLLVGASFDLAERNPLLGQTYDTSSAWLVAPDGTVPPYYAKMQLVPAGEYIPYMAVIPGMAETVAAGVGWVPNVKPGEALTHFALDPSAVAGSDTPRNTLSPDGRYWFAAPICYELAFPPTIRALAMGEKERPDDGVAGRPIDFFLNLSDDSWYRQSAELDQMLAMCRMRCIENRRGMARCTVTGITAFISPTGAVTAVFERNGRVKEAGPGVLTDRVAVSDAFSLYRLGGDWFPVACWVFLALVAVCATVVGRRRRYLAS